MNNTYPARRSSRLANYQRSTQQSGYTLVSILFIMLMITIMVSGSIQLGQVSEKSAGNAIQRSRAFQAADGGAAIAENQLRDRLKTRIYADSIASSGVFTAGSYDPKWWRTPDYAGEIEVEEDALLGVRNPPRHVFEEVGRYATDGGSGVVGLDLGSGTYGSRSRSGREVMLYRVESHGSGSHDGVQSVVETVVIHSY